MNAKILKYELFTLFFLTVITLVVFYYRDTLPDSYLSISSTSSHGFFAYYGTSLLNFINYYSGPWVLIPCGIFTSFYVFIFSKRADWIDALNVLTLSLFCVWTAYYLQPTLLGGGLFQLLTNSFSPFVSFLLWATSLVAFTWGTFRGDFTEKVKLITAKIKEADFKTPTEKARTFSEKYLRLITGKFSEKFSPQSQIKEIDHQEEIRSTPAKKEETRVIQIAPVIHNENGEIESYPVTITSAKE